MDGKLLIGYVETAVYFVLALVALGLEVWAFFDCLRHKANAFEAVSKRTKTFWLALTGGALAIGALSLFAGRWWRASARSACSASPQSPQPPSTSRTSARQ